MLSYRRCVERRFCLQADGVINAQIIKRYIALFLGVSQLSSEEDEDMVFSKLVLRLRVKSR
jgi:hypothetical protein